MAKSTVVGGGSKIFETKKKPKSTLLADNTRVDNNKINKAQPRPVASAAPHPMNRVRGSQWAF